MGVSDNSRVAEQGWPHAAQAATHTSPECFWLCALVSLALVLEGIGKWLWLVCTNTQVLECRSPGHSNGVQPQVCLTCSMSANCLAKGCTVPTHTGSCLFLHFQFVHFQPIHTYTPWAWAEGQRGSWHSHHSHNHFSPTNLHCQAG